MNLTTQIPTDLGLFISDLRNDLDLHTTPNLVRARQTLEAMQKTLECSQSTSTEELCRASTLFNEFLAKHQTDPTTPLNLLDERPTHTPMEFAIVSLIHRLFGRGVTPSILARLTIELPNGDSYSTAVAISLSQVGVPLNELIKSETFETEHGIDPDEYTEQLISHVLILPTDAHGANILVTNQRPRRLISIDLEASFVPMRIESSNEINFVSEVFCHEVIPHLSPRVLAKFNQIKTGDLLTAWLNEIIDNLEGWTQLFPNEKKRLLEPIIDSQDKCSLQRDIRCVVQCLIPPGTVARLYRQITHLKQLFETKKHIPISPFELLEGIITCWDDRDVNIGQYIAKRYRDSLKKVIWFKRPGPERLAKATGKIGQTSVCTSLTLRSLIGHLPTQQDLELETYHPKASLEELATITCLFESGIQMNYGKNLEVKVSDDHKFTIETQRMILRLLIASRGITHLRLPNFSVLTDILLERLVRSNCTTLITIDLRGCPEVSFKPILTHYSRLLQLEEMQFSGSSLGNFCLIFGQYVNVNPANR